MFRPVEKGVSAEWRAEAAAFAAPYGSPTYPSSIRRHGYQLGPDRAVSIGMLGPLTRARSILRARTVRFIGLVVTGFVVASCVRVPFADNLAKGPQIDELVQRVECDLYEAVGDRLRAPYGYEWLHSWTAQVNLNLIVNDQSQLSPGAVITEPLTAVSIPHKVTNFGQSWNLGLGALESTTATRNETLAFSVSLEELMQQFGDGHRKCDFPQYMDLRSELGVQEWISESFSPADHQYLLLGSHKGSKVGPTGAAAVKATAAAMSALKNVAPPPGTLIVGQCKRPGADSTRPPDRTAIQQDMAIVVCDLSTIHTFDPKTFESESAQFTAKTIADIQIAIRDLMVLGDETKGIRTALEKTAIKLAALLDPPIDTISHQVQFIIVLSASASPSWTLVRFKGPSPASGSLASAMKTKTHTLTVAIGSSAQDLQTVLTALQTGTAVSNALSSGAVTFVPH